MSPKAPAAAASAVSLYAAVEALCRANGIRVIIGVVAQPNPASNALHQRLGFRAAGELDGVGFKFDRWLGIRFYQRGPGLTRPGDLAVPNA
jgi:L-amino acid N-acyltransferase YncA